MSDVVTSDTMPSGAAVPDEPSDRGLPRWVRPVLWGVLILVIVSAVRVLVDGASELTTSGTARVALLYAVPIMLAGLGGLYSERAGVVNIGLEGMMIFGTWFGAWGGYRFGPWWGVLLGVLGGAVGGLIHAIATVSFGVNHIVSGVAINILAPGVTRFLASEVFSKVGGSAAQSPTVNGTTGRFTLPILSGGTLFGWHSPDILGWFEDRHWFLIADAAGLLKGATSEIPGLAVLAYVLVPITAFTLWRTRFGLRLRSAGENPWGADSLGVNVYFMKYVAVVLSGALAGMAGAMIVIENSNSYHENQTGGRGFIGLAAMLFGNYRPVGTAAGALLFGYADGLQRRAPETVHAALWIGIALCAVGVVLALTKRHPQAAAASFIAGAVLAIYWFQTSQVASDLVFMAPYLITLIVLAVKTQRVRPPAADGIVYRRGEER